MQSTACAACLGLAGRQAVGELLLACLTRSQLRDRQRALDHQAVGDGAKVLEVAWLIIDDDNCVRHTRTLRVVRIASTFPGGLCSVFQCIEGI